MKRQLVLRLQAEAGIARAVNFYKTRSETQMQNFIEILNEVFDNILASPYLYAVRWKTIRRVNLAKLPYALWYEIIPDVDPTTGEEMELVVVLGCYHQNQNVTTRSFE